MNALYLVVILFINANTGEFHHAVKGETPMTLEACTKYLIERGPQKVEGGLAQVGVCMKESAVNGHSDT